ncbi:hypothetical protein BY458DRAFT_574877, partial [Sporodiniella umbellata]
MESVMDILDKKRYFYCYGQLSDPSLSFYNRRNQSKRLKATIHAPYSSFLNPIKKCWSKIKKNIGRNPLDMLTARIAKTYKQFTVTDC